VIRFFSVTDLPPERRLPAWQKLVAEIFSPLEAVWAAPSEFNGELASGDLGALQLAEITSDVQLLLRTPRMITGADSDDYLFVLQVGGHSALSQDEREAALSPGDFAILDTTRPYQIAFPGPFQIFVITSPRKLVRLVWRDAVNVILMSG
jgi:AraC-like protein